MKGFLIICMYVYSFLLYRLYFHLFIFCCILKNDWYVYINILFFSGYLLWLFIPLAVLLLALILYMLG